MHPIHPTAELLPSMSDEDFSRLCADIQQNGLVEPIKLWHGQVIDGRHRLKACGLANVEPIFENMDHLTEDQVADYVRSLNMARRHMSNSEIAKVAAIFAARSRGKMNSTKLSEALIRKSLSIPAFSTKEPASEIGTEPVTPLRGKEVSIENAAKAAGVSKKSVEHATKRLVESGDIEPTRKKAVKELAEQCAASIKNRAVLKCVSGLEDFVSKIPDNESLVFALDRIKELASG